MLHSIAEIWNGLDTQIRPAAIAAIVTIATATLGALLVVWQIGRQARNAIRQNQHNEALKLKLELYKEFVTKSRAAAYSEINLGSYVRKFSTSLDIVKQLSASHAPWAAPQERAAVLLQRNNQLSDDVIELISLTERWQIIDPRIEIFRTAINVATHDVNKAFQSYFLIALQTMPVERAETGPLFPWAQPSPDISQQLDERGSALQDALMSLGSFIYDMQAEMQNLLLGGLFKNKILPRRPLDPTAVVVQLGRWKELNDYFENHTEWGAAKKAAELQVIQGLSQAEN